MDHQADQDRQPAAADHGRTESYPIDTTIVAEYRRLEELRSALMRSRERLNGLLDAGRTSAVAEGEAERFAAAFDAVEAQEQRILALEARSARDLAIKVVVCGENDFSSERLNELLWRDANRLMDAA